MFEQLNTENIDEKILLIYSEKGCMKKHLPRQIKGQYSFYLNTFVTGCEEKEFSCHMIQGDWYVKDKMLSEKAPAYLFMDGMQLILFLAENITCLQPCMKLEGKQEEEITVGNAYRNTVFYTCFSFIEEEHLSIIYDGHAYSLQKVKGKGVYLNQKAVTKACSLKQGDWIDVFGLHILVLKDFLVITVFQGAGRVAGRWNEKGYLLQKSDMDKIPKMEVMRENGKEQLLHKEEVEILPPAARERINKSPLLLGIGPGVTMILPVILMACLGSYMAQGNGNFYYLTVIMSVCSGGLTLFWGLVNHFYAAYQRKNREKNRVIQYREYLLKIRTYLLCCQEENRNILENRYPPVSFFQEEENKIRIMWNRFHKHKDFLWLRVGTGNMSFQMKIKSPEEKSIVPEVLLEEAGRLAEEMSILSRVPLGIDLGQSKVVGIWGEKGAEELCAVLRQLLFQIAAGHAYTEVKIACFYEKKSDWQCGIAGLLKWMPHIWSANRKIRYLAGDEREAAEILPDLTTRLERGREDSHQRTPQYVIVVLDKQQIQGEVLYRYLTEAPQNYPVCGLFLERRKEALPVGLECLICLNSNGGEIIYYDEEQVAKEPVKPEYCKETVLEKYLRQLSGYRIKEEREAKLPDKVSFLELYQCESLQQLNCRERWKNHKPEERMKVPIGVGAEGNKVFLDMHEKFHGPHGLIAGTTGAGKSELIQTCILSMAVSFSPQDVNFFIIDYKGGGTGNILQELPHCSGVISNLSGKQIKRAMSAISSENRRRQKLLSHYGVNHIDGYMELFRKGKVKEAMPHLLLIVDEFAELKKEEPEFMQEIISLAQVGRSLGIHLVLATQKPAGTVDDKIWSNARFRLCLRVQDRQDSMDMLRKPDAALLTTPGQCYLQIGNHEYYELFQTAYCGDVYSEEGVEREKVLLVQDTGRRTGPEKGKKKIPGKTQLEFITGYIRQQAKENAWEKAKSLWLAELEEVIVLEQLQKGEAFKEEEGYILGLCDDPSNQQKYPAHYIPQKHGHLGIFGGPATGKTTCLQTLLWQMVQKKQEELRILLVDLGGGLWQSFQFFPQLMGYVKKPGDIQVFFYHLEELFARRSKLLSGINYLQYRRAQKGNLPEIYLVIDHYAGLAKFLNEHQEEILLRLLTEGINYGIFVLFTASAIGEIPGKMFSKIKKTIALEMSEKFSYGDVLRQYHIDVFPAENVKGRGLCREKEEILEFQVALALPEEDDYRRMEEIQKRGKEMQKEVTVAEVFPRIPEQVSSPALCEGFLWKANPYRIPIGYDTDTAREQTLETKEGRFLILGGAKTGKKNLLAHMAVAFIYQGREVCLYDNKKQFGFWSQVTQLQIISQWEELQQWRSDMKEKDYAENSCLLIGDLAEFVRELYAKKESNQMEELWEEEAAGDGVIGYIAGCYRTEADYGIQSTVFFQKFIRWQQGICLGGNLSEQRLLSFEDLSYSRQTQKEKQGIGYLKAGRGAGTLRLALPFYEGREKIDNSGCGSTCTL